MAYEFKRAIESRAHRKQYHLVMIVLYYVVDVSDGSACI